MTVKPIILFLAFFAVLPAEDASVPEPQEPTIKERVKGDLIDYSSLEERQAIDKWLVQAKAERQMALSERITLKDQAITLSKQHAELKEQAEGLTEGTSAYQYHMSRMKDLEDKRGALLSESGKKLFYAMEMKKLIDKAEKGLSDNTP